MGEANLLEPTSDWHDSIRSEVFRQEAEDEEEEEENAVKKSVEIFNTNIFYLKLHILWVLIHTIYVHFDHLKRICKKASYTSCAEWAHINVKNFPMYKGFF